MRSAKSILQGCVASQRHYLLGEIRTERLSGRRRRTKRTTGAWGKGDALEAPRRRFEIYIVVEFLNNHLNQEFPNDEFASAN